MADNIAALTYKTVHQDAIKASLDNWPRSKQLMTYKYLNAQGCKIDGIDWEIAKEIKKELTQS